jgi:hypothetical protein
MKLFAIAFGIVCGVAAGLFGLTFALLSFFEYPQAVLAAGALAGTVITAFPKVAEFLERQEGRKSLAAGRGKPVYDFHGFQIAWPLMLVYGTVLLSFLLQAISMIAGIVLGSVISFEVENAPKVAGAGGLLTMIMMIFAAYFVGRWIGARTSRLGIVTMFLIAPLTAAITVGTDVLFMSDEWYRSYNASERLAFFGILMRITKISFLIIVPGLIGYWRGQRQRLSKYLDYLLGVLPPQTRDIVVELAFEEAQKVSAAVGDARPSDRANLRTIS